MAGIDDDSGAFPGGDEGASGGGIAVLEDEVVEVGHAFDEAGDARFDFADLGAAIDDLAARGAQKVCVAGDGSGKGEDSGVGDSATHGTGVVAGGVGEVADEFAGGFEFLIAEADDGAFCEVHLGAVGEVAYLFQVDA